MFMLKCVHLTTTALKDGIDTQRTSQPTTRSNHILHTMPLDAACDICKARYQRPARVQAHQSVVWARVAINIWQPDR
jgi:hypothetical protein